MPSEIKLIIFSDFHGNNTHSPELGYLLKDKQQARNAVTIFAGDFRGKVDYDDAQDKSGNLEIDILNILLGKNSVITIGNHDTIGGMRFLVPLLKKLKRPLIVTNAIVPPKSPLEGLIIPETIHTMADGNEFVFLGVAIAHTQEHCLPSELQIQPLENSVNLLLQQIKKHYEQGRRNIIIVSHLGIVDDQNLAQKLTHALTVMHYKLDIVIVGGHSHDVTEKCIVIGDKNFSQAFVVQNGIFDDAYAYYAELNLRFSNGKIVAAETVLVDLTSDKLEKLPEIENLLAELTRSQEKMKKNVLTQVRGPLSGLDWYITNQKRWSHAGHIRINDSALMRLFADIMVTSAKRINAEIKYHAFLPAAWYRYNFPVDTAGAAVPFNEYHMHRIDAWNEHLATMQLTGEQLYQSIEQGVSKLKWMQSGGLLHVDDSINYVYDAARDPGKRVLFISIDGHPVEKSRLYSIVTIRSLTQGKAEHPELSSIKSTLYDQIKLKDIFIAALKQMYSGEVIDESFGKRILCLFPEATPENIVAKIEKYMNEYRKDATTQHPLPIQQLDFDDFEKRQEMYLQKRQDMNLQHERDKVSGRMLNTTKFPLHAVSELAPPVNATVVAQNPSETTEERQDSQNSLVPGRS